jgi:hypothetical protein
MKGKRNNIPTTIKPMFKPLLIFFLLAKSAISKLGAQTSNEETNLFWSRLLAGANLDDYKPKQSVTTFGLITEEEVSNMNKAWGETLIGIGKTYEEEGFDAAKALTEQALKNFFCYHLGIPVGLKPSRSIAPQTFRTTPEAALAYYVGNNSAYPNDKGFALKGWIKVENYPATVLLLGRMALSMGTEHLTDKNGNITLVDKTWGLMKEDDGNICIVIQHGSVPYSPDI